LQLLTLLNQVTCSRSVTAVLGTDVRLSSLVFFGTVLLFEVVEKKGDVYNVLWVVVFAFATLNILSLGAKRFEPRQNRMSFGEVLAVMTVVVSVFLLAWEMLYLFKVLPIRLSVH
jgi:hypothetical protein